MADGIGRLQVTRDRYIVERSCVYGSHANVWLVMTSSGDVSEFETAEQAYASIQRREKRKVGKARARVTAIEWRGVPEGWTPPGAERSE